MRKNILAAVFLAICPLAFAQQALNNDAIIKLVKAGMSDDLIITTINAQPGNFDVSMDADITGITILETKLVHWSVCTAIGLIVGHFTPEPFSWAAGTGSGALVCLFW